MNLEELNWNEELERANDLSEREREYIRFVIQWFESWRESRNLASTRDVARRFWKEAIVRKLRASWQLEQWAMGMRWYLERIEHIGIPAKRPAELIAA